MNKKITLLTLIHENIVLSIFISILFLSTYIFNILEVKLLDYFINNFHRISSLQILAVFIMLSAIYGVYYIHEPSTEFFRSLLTFKFGKPMEAKLIDKVSRISMQVLEKEENQALITRLQNRSKECFIAAFFGVLSIFGSIICIIGIFNMLFRAGAIFIVIMSFMLALMIIMFLIVGKKKVQMSRARQEISRRSDYLSEILFDKRLVQEKKLFSYTDFIHNLYEKESIKSENQMFRSIFITNVVIWIYDNITYIFAASSYILLLVPLSEKKISIGLYVALVPALIRVASFCVSIVRDYYPSLKEYAACIEDFHKFGQLQEQYYSIEYSSVGVPPFHNLLLKDVSFSYDEANLRVLNHLNLNIECGKNYALVGVNGCGKSTLIKLLLGLYKPEEGEILLDGTEIGTIPFDQLQNYYSVIFQDFNHYDYSLRDNIVISDLRRKKNEDRMKNTIQDVGMNKVISKLPQKYNTILGNLWENGTELSIGQWQKLAISRLLFRNAPIYIWDEPTASMDPVSESKLYSYYQEQMSKNCTNIFITHRLGAAVMADVICVMDGGKIVEKGSHSDLMNKTDGIYKNMFEMQKGLYV